ncbi:hypothetical protein J6590_035319 [Homalodisca vitripennis]|nr:hypothetical protein J6590_035319 [Homalodisca vitripennis]
MEPYSLSTKAKYQFSGALLPNIFHATSLLSSITNERNIWKSSSCFFLLRHFQEMAQFGLHSGPYTALAGPGDDIRQHAHSTQFLQTDVWRGYVKIVRKTGLSTGLLPSLELMYGGLDKVFTNSQVLEWRGVNHQSTIHTDKHTKVIDKNTLTGRSTNRPNLQPTSGKFGGNVGPKVGNRLNIGRGGSGGGGGTPLQTGWILLSVFHSLCSLFSVRPAPYYSTLAALLISNFCIRHWSTVSVRCSVFALHHTTVHWQRYSSLFLYKTLVYSICSLFSVRPAPYYSTLTALLSLFAVQCSPCTTLQYTGDVTRLYFYIGHWSTVSVRCSVFALHHTTVHWRLSVRCSVFALHHTTVHWRRYSSLFLYKTLLHSLCPLFSVRPEPYYSTLAALLRCDTSTLARERHLTLDNVRVESRIVKQSIQSDYYLNGSEPR